MNVNRRLKLCLNLNGIWEFFLEFVFFFSFDYNFNEFVGSTSHCHLCSRFERLSSFSEEYVVGIILCSVIMLF